MLVEQRAKKLPEINKDLAYRLYQEQEELAAGEMSKKKKAKVTRVAFSFSYFYLSKKSEL
jgi:hypothetical protein